MDRRKFFKTSALAGMALSSGVTGSSCMGPEALLPFSGKRLVLVKLSGGNDGLFALSPREHDIIDAARPTLAKAAKSNGIGVFEGWLLNYYLRDLEPLLGKGELALLPFVGYPSPNTSHFKSSEIWDAGFLPGEQFEKTGWIGRLLDAGTLAIPGNDAPAISLADSEALVIKGLRKQGISWNGNEPLEWYEADIRHWMSHHRHNRIAGQVFKAYSTLHNLSDITPQAGFPASSLGNQLARVASMIHKDKPYRVFYTVQSGYDTHYGAEERLKELYVDLGASLARFARVLKASGHWKETLVLAYSEFGRTIDENANLGTDHGAAGLCFLLGDNPIVRQYTGIVPQIKFTAIAGEIFLGHDMDFREIYAVLKSGWLV
ncbi:MAG: DUF1501 domain-containing protein [Saprospiraceae bacterium]